jgi:hypothetical protein
VRVGTTLLSDLGRTRACERERGRERDDEGLMQRGNKLCFFFHVCYVHFIGEYNNKDNKVNMKYESIIRPDHVNEM